MDFPADTYFFHYTTREAAFDHIVPSGELWLSPYDQMNDPLENQPWRFTGAFYGEPEPGPDGHERAYLEFTRHAHEIWGSAKLLALTVDAPPDAGYDLQAAPFGRGWARARMWDQYAERHRGVCLLFDRAALTASIGRSLENQGLAPPYHKAIAYTDEGPAQRLLNLDLNALAGTVSAVVVRQFVEEHNDALFFLKTTDWRTEFEYRFVVTAPDCERVVVDYGDALKAAIVGQKFPRWQRPGAVELCREKEVDPALIDWSTGRPRPMPLRAT